MMSWARTARHSCGLLGVALLAAGCGGGGAVTGATADPNATPSTTGTPGATVANPAGTTTDPATGAVIDPAADASATATIPTLVGDDISGGLQSGNGDEIFSARAGEASEIAASEEAKDATSDETTKSTTPAAAFGGAKIYVDGIVYSVDTRGTFPKANPAFRLVKVTSEEIEIELIAGEFTTGGGEGTVLDKGDLVTLVNSSEQLTYRVKYLRPIEAADAVPI